MYLAEGYCNQVASRCSFCNKELSSKKSLSRHLKICKKNSNAESRLSCICGSSFSRKDGLLAHHKTCSLVHENDPISQYASALKKCDLKKGKFECYYTDCQTKMTNFKEMISHLKMIHHVKMNPVQFLKFSSESEFNSWKDNEEIKSLSYFSKQTGSKGKYTYLYCQHDGSSRAHRKSSEPSRISLRRHKLGQIKKNARCIARIIIKNEGSSLAVQYHSTHSHPLKKSDLLHQPATSRRISLNLLSKDIHQSLQTIKLEKENRMSNKGNRNMITTETSIKQCIAKTKNKSNLNEDDAASVYHLVNELKQEKYNSVILYKPCGMDIQVGPDKLTCLPLELENLFMIGLQTKEQKDLLIEGAKKILIADDTHNITQYENIRLLSILIVDENNRGWPVGHFISNSMASNVIAYFVRALNASVKQAGEELNINCLITDDDPALIKGFETGLDVSIRHILCQWHLDQTLQKNIRGKANCVDFQSIYDEIKVIVSTKNSHEFDELYSEYLINHKEDSPKFVEYLERYYSNRTEKWAMSSRVGIGHGSIDTTSHAKLFHNKLKTKYLERLPNKRMDDIVKILLQIEKGNFSKRKRLAIHEDCEKRHTESLSIPDDLICTISPFLWQIASSTKTNQYYFVEKCDSSCSTDLCFEKCSQLSCSGLCSHSYQCSCPDTHPICKHQHKLHSYLRKGEPIHIDNDFENSADENSTDEHSFDENLLTYEEIVETRDSSETRAYERLTQNLKKVERLVEQKNLPPHLVQSGNVFLEQFIRRIETEAEPPRLELKYFPEERKIHLHLLPFNRKKKRKSENSED